MVSETDRLGQLDSSEPTNSSRTVSGRDSISADQLRTLNALASALLKAVESLFEESQISTADRINLPEEVLRFEMHLIGLALGETNGNQREAARFLNLKYTTLSSKIQRYRMAVKRAPKQPRSEVPKPSGQ